MRCHDCELERSPESTQLPNHYPYRHSGYHPAAYHWDCGRSLLAMSGLLRLYVEQGAGRSDELRGMDVLYGHGRPIGLESMHSNVSACRSQASIHDEEYEAHVGGVLGLWISLVRHFYASEFGHDLSASGPSVGVQEESRVGRVVYDRTCSGFDALCEHGAMLFGCLLQVGEAGKGSLIGSPGVGLGQ